jgi:hypothetical protein
VLEKVPVKKVSILVALVIGAVVIGFLWKDKHGAPPTAKPSSSASMGEPPVVHVQPATTGAPPTTTGQITWATPRLPFNGQAERQFVLSTKDRLPNEGDTTYQTRLVCLRLLQDSIAAVQLDDHQIQLLFSLLNDAHQEWRRVWEEITRSNRMDMMKQFMDTTSDAIRSEMAKVLRPEQLEMYDRSAVRYAATLAMPDGLLQAPAADAP